MGYQIEAHVNLPSLGLNYVVETAAAAPVAAMASGDIAVHNSVPVALAGDAVAEMVAPVALVGDGVAEMAVHVALDGDGVAEMAAPVALAEMAALVAAVVVPEIAVAEVFHLLMVL